MLCYISCNEEQYTKSLRTTCVISETSAMLQMGCFKSLEMPFFILCTVIICKVIIQIFYWFRKVISVCWGSN